MILKDEDARILTVYCMSIFLGKCIRGRVRFWCIFYFLLYAAVQLVLLVGLNVTAISTHITKPASNPDISAVPDIFQFQTEPRDPDS